MCMDKTKEKSHDFRVLQDMEFELCWRDNGKLWKGIKQESDMLPFMSRKFTLKTVENGYKKETILYFSSESILIDQKRYAGGGLVQADGCKHGENQTDLRHILVTG